MLLDASGIDFDNFANYPGMLDALFQVAAVIRDKNNLGDTVLHIPVGIKRMIASRVYQPVSKKTVFTGRIEITSGMETNAQFMEMNVVMFQDGKPIFYAEGFNLLGLSKEQISSPSQR